MTGSGDKRVRDREEGDDGQNPVEPADDATRIYPDRQSETVRMESGSADGDPEEGEEATRLKDSPAPAGIRWQETDEPVHPEGTRIHRPETREESGDSPESDRTRVHRTKPLEGEEDSETGRDAGDPATVVQSLGDQPTEVEGTEVLDDSPPHSSGRDLPSERSRAPEGTIRDNRKHSGAPLSVGSVLRGRFRIEGVLGEGGMGTVFTAVDLLKEEAHDENVHVALKIMKEDIADARLSFMGLQREARRAQQLAHPNIVTVYDFDRADGVIYMTMEFLRGEPLDEALKKNPHGLENKVAQDITVQICRGLAHAHKEGIVHSDLKPQNVFVLENGRAKILDFGIARAYQAKKLDRVEAAFSGYSPAYASPQIFEKKSPRPTDDVFALGCLVYQLFTGAHPFDWVSADKAVAKGMRPKKHSAFSRAQWATVSAALSFDAAKRPKDGLDFLKRFAPSYVKRLAFGVSAASIAAAVAFVLIFQPTPGPEVPFEELPAEVQQQITRNLGDARQFQEHGDLNTALQLYDAVLTTHPGNLDGVEGMNETVRSVLDRIDEGLDSGQMRPGDARRSLESVLAYESLPSRSRRAIENRLESL